MLATLFVSFTKRVNFLGRNLLRFNSIAHCKSGPIGMNLFKSFNFTSYNSIGFDLDHTLCQYNLENIIKLQYKLLVDYLIEKGGFPSDIFSEDFTFDDIDFIQRGLFLDFNKGNILYVSENGLIVKACHGTRSLSSDEIRRIYGPSMMWEPTTLFAEDILSVWEPPWSDIMRSMMDFTDAQVPLVFAQVIDYIDRSCPGTACYSVWPVILDGIVDMFKPNGSYYLNLYSSPHLYLKKCKPVVLDWMNKLRTNGLNLFLLTGARKKEAEFLANYSLGKDWKQLFHFIIYDAKKPGFFTLDRPFLESKYIFSNKLTFPLELTQGNWKDLHSLISAETSVESPKCVYIGDNLLQDVYITSLTKNIDSIAMVEELSEEKMLKGKFDRHPTPGYVSSNRWYSYTYTPDSNFTVWGSIMRNHSKLSIPSLEYLANKPINHSFIPFWVETSKL